MPLEYATHARHSMPTSWIPVRLLQTGEQEPGRRAERTISIFS